MTVRCLLLTPRASVALRNRLIPQGQKSPLQTLCRYSSFEVRRVRQHCPGPPPVDLWTGEITWILAGEKSAFAHGLLSLPRSCRFNLPNNLHVGASALKWGDAASFGRICSPLCSPLLVIMSEREKRTQPVNEIGIGAGESLYPVRA